jgi:acyl carrier protein
MGEPEKSAEPGNIADARKAPTADEQKVLEILRSGFFVDDQDLIADELDMQTRIDILGVDSLQLSEVIFELEDRFSVEIGDEELVALTEAATVGEFISIFLKVLPPR